MTSVDKSAAPHGEGTGRVEKGGTSDNTPTTAAATAAAAATEAASAIAVAVADKARWADLETWLNCSLSALETCTRCVNWTSAVGYVGAMAYVRLFTLVLRLLCPVSGRRAAAGVSSEDADVERLFEGLRCGGGGAGSAGAGVGVGAGGGATGVAERTGAAGGAGRAGGERAIDDDGAGGEEGEGRLSWARDRLAQVVDDLMWRLREGLPGRDIRLRLLQVRLSTVRRWLPPPWRSLYRCKRVQVDTPKTS